MVFMYSVIMHITLILPVKAHCCVSIYTDVEGPAFRLMYSLKSAFILVQLTKEEGGGGEHPVRVMKPHGYHDVPSFLKKPTTTKPSEEHSQV